jgi:hypothetical protein
MLIQFGTIVTGASGSIGGITLARNANSAYARKKVKSVNPNTIPQQNRRNAFGANSRAWKGLSSSEQSTWAIAAKAFPYKNKLNIASTYTGFQLFSKFNNQLSVVGAVPLTTAPLPVSIDGIEITGVLIGYSPDALLINVTDTTAEATVVPADCVMVIAATAPLSSGITKPKKPDFRVITQLADGESISGVDVTTAYITIFGSFPPVNANVFLEAYLVSTVTGQVGKRVQFLAQYA